MAAAKKAAGDGQTIELVRLVSPGAFVEGNLTQLVKSTGKGRQCGWSLVEDERGVVASKEGEKTIRFPWSHITQVDYL